MLRRRLTIVFAAVPVDLVSIVALLEGVDGSQDVVCEEAFGPVAVLSRFDDFEDALAAVNSSKFGLQAGIFTRDLYKAQRAWDVLEEIPRPSSAR